MNSVPLLGWGCSLTITLSTGAPSGPRTTPLHDPVEDVAEAITPEMAKISAKTVGTRSIHEVYLLKQPTRPILSDIEEADASTGATRLGVESLARYADIHREPASTQSRLNVSTACTRELFCPAARDRENE